MISSQVLPAAYIFQGNIASSVNQVVDLVPENVLKPQKELLVKVSTLISTIQTEIGLLKSIAETAKKIEDEQAKADTYCNKVKSKMDEIRKMVDELETMTDDELWPMPKYWEMLFLS